VNIKELVNTIIPSTDITDIEACGAAYAPTNIALCKYWGKRNKDLNLPTVSSLSITLPTKGAITRLAYRDAKDDLVIVNGNVVPKTAEFYTRVVTFLDLFRPKNLCFAVKTNSNVPISAGLASSACGFAAMVLALNDLFSWQLPLKQLSILARLGSGSACRSLYPGFVIWNKGLLANGLDSFAKKVDIDWPELCIGIVLLTTEKKNISSRKAMQISVNSPGYPKWIQNSERDIEVMLQAIFDKDFLSLGLQVENNSKALHALMLSSEPSIQYSNSATEHAKGLVADLRAEGIDVFFTQDAGANLKLLFLQQDAAKVRAKFTHLEILQPFTEQIQEYV